MWNLPLTFIQCQGWVWVALSLHSPISFCGKHGDNLTLWCTSTQVYAGIALLMMPSISLHIISCKIFSEQCGKARWATFSSTYLSFYSTDECSITLFIYHCLWYVCKFHMWALYISLFCNLQFILYPTEWKYMLVFWLPTHAYIRNGLQ